MKYVQSGVVSKKSLWLCLFVSLLNFVYSNVYADTLVASSSCFVWDYSEYAWTAVMDASFAPLGQADCYIQDGCFGGLGASGKDCYKWSVGPSGSPVPWVKPVCYWMENRSGQYRWVPTPYSPSTCYRLDSCSGGLGFSRGGCYKLAWSPVAGRVVAWEEFIKKGPQYPNVSPPPGVN